MMTASTTLTVTATNREHRHPTVLGGDGQTISFLGDEITFKLGGRETGGAYSMHESITPPGGGASFLHTHAPQETFYVLEGDFEFYGLDGDKKYVIRAGAGSTVHIPVRAPHGYRNVGATPGRTLVIFAPAGNMELLLAEGGIPIGEQPVAPPDPALLARLIEKYDIEMLEPIGGSSVEE